jgi:hypothetical protein
MITHKRTIHAALYTLLAISTISVYSPAHAMRSALFCLEFSPTRGIARRIHSNMELPADRSNRAMHFGKTIRSIHSKADFPADNGAPWKFDEKQKQFYRGKPLSEIFVAQSAPVPVIDDKDNDMITYNQKMYSKDTTPSDAKKKTAKP